METHGAAGAFERGAHALAQPVTKDGKDQF